MQQPARKQVQDSKQNTAYVEGGYEYNIWYDKYLTDRRTHEERIVSMYKCDPDKDTGFTKADNQDTDTYFCVYFARGNCIEGANCHFYHRVPRSEDLRSGDNTKDVFGRTRHATYKDNLTGVGSFAENCTVLRVEGIKMTHEIGP